MRLVVLYYPKWPTWISMSRKVNRGRRSYNSGGLALCLQGRDTPCETLSNSTCEQCVFYLIIKYSSSRCSRSKGAWKGLMPYKTNLISVSVG